MATTCYTCVLCLMASCIVDCNRAVMVITATSFLRKFNLWRFRAPSHFLIALIVCWFVCFLFCYCCCFGGGGALTFLIDCIINCSTYNLKLYTLDLSPVQLLYKSSIR